MTPMKGMEAPKMEQEHTDAEIMAAREAFEHLARRLDALWSKERLTPAERKEIDLILNNAMVVEEMLEGKTPEEFDEERKRGAT